MPQSYVTKLHARSDGRVESALTRLDPNRESKRISARLPWLRPLRKLRL
jgi:hypothetical protein